MRDEGKREPRRTWQWLVEEIEKEQDFAKIPKLAEELRRALEVDKAKPISNVFPAHLQVN